MPWYARYCLAGMLFLAMLGCAPEHHDDDEDDAKPTASAVTAPESSDPAAALYAQECGSCHLAYPARFLPSGSWEQLLQGLARHFGEDASLNPAQVTQLQNYLQAHAGKRRVDEEAPLRITASPWFVHEHDELGDAVWARASIKTPANCAACHRKAEHGSFRERDLRIPGS